MIDVKCRICGEANKADCYNDWTCSLCGQQYEYAEDHRIVLTYEQIELLRTVKGVKRPPCQGCLGRGGWSTPEDPKTPVTCPECEGTGLA